MDTDETQPVPVNDLATPDRLSSHEQLEPDTPVTVAMLRESFQLREPNKTEPAAPRDTSLPALPAPTMPDTEKLDGPGEAVPEPVHVEDEEPPQAASFCFACALHKRVVSCWPF